MTTLMHRSSNLSDPTHGWVDSPSTRGTFEVIWTCFFTIFVCTFTVLHLNVPASNDEHWQILLRKIKWMTFSVVIPEAVTASAFAQYVSARQSVRSMKLLEPKHDWSMRHAFYWNMGGVCLLPKDHSTGFPINATQQYELFARGIECRPRISSKEIWDKSKADKFVKALACLQISWLAGQCIGRAAQHLPISVLELATVGFAAPSLATFALWFNKPADIETPTTIHTELTIGELLARLRCGTHCRWYNTPLDSLDFANQVNKPSFVSGIILKSENWPGRSRYDGPATRIRNDIFGLKYSKLDQSFVGFIWLGYSAIHLSAWDFDFPSYAEKTLWRVSCLVMSGSMILFWVFINQKFYLLFGFLSPAKRKAMAKISNERTTISPIQVVLSAVTGIAYVAARFCLIVQSLVALRALPAGVFDNVNWWKFVPHV